MAAFADAWIAEEEEMVQSAQVDPEEEERLQAEEERLQAEKKNEVKSRNMSREELQELQLS